MAAKASGETSYDDYVYERYADVLWDYEHNCAKKYSYIVLSPIQRKNSGDGSAETIARSMSSIIGDIGTSDTRFVLHYTQERMKGTLEELIQKQTEIDKSYDTAIEIVKSDDSISDKYLSVDAARAAKAYCNYMMYYGEDKAIKTEKAAFKIYDTNLSRHGYRNDIYLGEGEHLTVLGSYMMAASIYEALYGESDSCLSTFDISEKYFGQTTEESMNLRFKNFYKTNYGLCYNDGEGFKNKDICRAANFIVEQTQLNSMNFTTKADVDAWKSDASKSNFSY